MDELRQAGPGGLVAPGRVVAAGRWDSAPIRRAARKARAEGRLIDLTYGHACKWVLFMDSGHVVLGTSETWSVMRET